MANRFLKIGVFAAEIATIVWILLFSPSTSYSAIAAIAFLVVLGVMAETKVLILRHVPSRHSTSIWTLGFQRTVSWEGVALLLPLMAIFTHAANAFPPPAWFPTQHGAWLFVPFFLFGLLALKRRW